MLSKNNRLKKQRDFSIIYNRGRSYVSDLFIMYVRHTSSEEQLCGFSISKKVAKAHERNLIRRRATEILRPKLPQMKTGIRLIFVARKSAGGTDYEHMTKAIDRLIQKAELYL